MFIMFSCKTPLASLQWFISTAIKVIYMFIYLFSVAITCVALQSTEYFKQCCTFSKYYYYTAIQALH